MSQAPDLQDIQQDSKQHQWAAGGVSTYPLTHPIVGQGTFYNTFKQFIHVVDQESEQFAHVFAIIAQWGIGKSRLAYELISQINDTSRGWYVRNEAGTLVNASLFNDERDREQYLGLYIRYSQIANEHHNIDNWFGYGLYKALLPLARGEFDRSIQGQIAQEGYDRLLTQGFDEARLAELLEVNANHSDATLYEDPYLVTRLCQAAYNYLQEFGIQYILVALDELETVAETSTYGLEDRDIKHMDGRAIKLLGKAIKEEDPRRKLPWLRYVALCSPAIGDELREIQSTARRFELVDLSQNAFADVSDFVRTLAQEGRLSEQYPPGLVEAAYAMSGGNFGWFNVIMANVDGRLRIRRIEKQKDGKGPGDRSREEPLTVGTLFDELVKSSSRIRDYVLDDNAINELQIQRAYLPAAKELLYAQLPVPLSQWQPDPLQALLTAQNEYNEPVALRYRQMSWDELECSQALRAAKFERKPEGWQLAGTSQFLDLRQLLDNLSTYAIYAHQNEETDGSFNRTADGKRILLVPLHQSDFIELVSFLYPHPSAEDAARALWQYFLGATDISEDTATHIGPSIAMLERLDLRYRKRSQTSLIFRDPDQSSAHEQAMSDRKQQPAHERAREVLTGMMRVLDQNWGYDPVSPGFTGDFVAIATPRGSRGRDQGGLATCDALKLHPKGRAILVWVQNEPELESLCEAVSRQNGVEGKTPVIAFTSSRALVDRLKNPAASKLKAAQAYLLLYQLSANEEYVLHRVGLRGQDQQGFQIEIANFNTTFTQRINAFQRGLLEEVQRWRHSLNQRGWIAWPLRPSGSLKADEKELLRQAWKYLLLKTSEHSLYQIDESSGLNIEAITAVLEKLGLSRSIRAAGYSHEERATLFSGHESNDKAEIPPFLVRVLDRFVAEKKPTWTEDLAKQTWFWGYTWEGAKPKDTFNDWLSLTVDLGFAVSSPTEGFNFLQLSTLNSRIQAAENWLTDEYPNIVLKIQEVFGEGAINDLFGALEGTETVKARSNIQRAKECYRRLSAEEGNYTDTLDLSQKRSRLLEFSQQRLELMAAIENVYNQDAYGLLIEENVRTLELRNDKDSLWRRIRRAELFADRILRIRDEIIRQIDHLQPKMHAEAAGLSHFPTQLFTLSLEKIRHILEGAIREKTPLGSTAQQQMTDASALGQCLKGLRVADAMNRLTQLSREVGLSIEGASIIDVPFEDIDGQIVSGFRRFKQAFENLQGQLEEAKSRLNKLEKLLEDAPEDFSYPPGIDRFEQLQLRPSFIEDSLAAIQEDEVDTLRDDPLYDRPAKQGNFQPLMKAADSLLNAPRQQLNQLRTQLLTLDNAIGGYIGGLVNQSDIQLIETSFNQLLKAKGQPPRPPLSRLELEQADSLRAAIAKLEARRHDWVQEAHELLPEAVSFGRWQRIVAAIEQGADPALEPQEEEQLIRAGLLVRTYRLGGQ
ncbi:hypothetical protein [Lyngbya confervoides]|uniref:Uncharacterized protein n=1 Tax=Lyngbya confervoides BDU141951 TaxID=1574623 RepID=A0ABD4T8J4_9CYAN|nr:hypothetical protein [Lyngbya confervoides]MCM1984754.1 hypothetical protein [Lyngbya confervoides BDU141951]